ncbi:MAG: hypothetical protein RL021_758, partial [Bacteroidota bacterium]
ATGDVNGDGLEDFYIGNAAGAKGKLYIQTEAGFKANPQSDIEADSLKEDGESLFFDAENDGDLDLLVVSGGNEFEDGSPELEDRLYLNDGKGNFIRSRGMLPIDTVAGLCIAGSDYDLDGDIDLFIGGCVRHAGYGLPVPSRLLENRSGNLIDVTSERCPELLTAGMVMDGAWADMDGDKRPDLIIAGEWMPIRLFMNKKEVLLEQTPGGLPNTSGWWNCLAVADLDGDGDADLVGGNRGNNEQMKVSPEHPASIFIKDFDGNGTIDPVITYWIKDGYYPMASRDELLDQMLPLRKKYIYYRKYAAATIDSIFTPAQLQDATIRKAVEFRSMWFENDGSGQLNPHPLPVEAQLAPVNAIAIADLNGDKKNDILLGGNHYGLRAEMGRADASFGLLLAGDGNGRFTTIPSDRSGLMLRGECRDLKMLKTDKGERLVLAGMNNQTIIGFQILK